MDVPPTLESKAEANFSSQQVIAPADCCLLQNTAVCWLMLLIGADHSSIRSYSPLGTGAGELCPPEPRCKTLPHIKRLSFRMVLTGANCCQDSLLVVTATRSCWYLMKITDSCWLLLPASDCCWGLLITCNCCWQLLTVADICWFLVTATDTYVHSCWLLPTTADKCW